MINVIAWVIVIALFLSPVALVALVAVPSWRRWWLRPIQRRRAVRREQDRRLQQARRDARTAVLEVQAELAIVPEREL